MQQPDQPERPADGQRSIVAQVIDDNPWIWTVLILVQVFLLGAVVGKHLA